MLVRSIFLATMTLFAFPVISFGENSIFLPSSLEKSLNDLRKESRYKLSVLSLQDASNSKILNKILGPIALGLCRKPTRVMNISEFVEDRKLNVWANKCFITTIPDKKDNRFKGLKNTILVPQYDAVNGEAYPIIFFGRNQSEIRLNEPALIRGGYEAISYRNAYGGEENVFQNFVVLGYIPQEILGDAKIIKLPLPNWDIPNPKL